MKPDFETMSKAELRAYVLANRSDNEAFYKLVDCLKADNKDAVRYPFVKTAEDLAKMEEIIRDRIIKLDES
ncbi:DUF6887 family protein [Argonema galeatum]|uniref:DUF6887 family protein n=1 Tax=Argonema galeatum TaxID=2942762 RepID=UPI0020133292|nr:hypothetical protein [Argonema galeatum]MCL1463353.1 hypothetical protein [Argonema galeatum A003/A1]